MKTILEQMIEAYQPKNNEEKRNVIKEVMQEITLCALSKAGFFDVAAFYGGTALRIFYGLDRFSEDLDFSLMTKNKDFDLSTYVPSLKRIVQSFGLNVDVEIKHKTSDSVIQSAFLKGDTIEQFLLFYPNDLVTGINKNEKVKIKFEIDTMPAGLATYETKYRRDTGRRGRHATRNVDTETVLQGGGEDGGGTHHRRVRAQPED